MAVDSEGNVYIADSDNSEIEEVSAATHDLSIVAGTGSPGPPTPGPATSSELFYPSGVAVDSEGNVFIADSDNNEVEEVSASTHDLSIVAGTGEAGPPTPGPATASELSHPDSVALDQAGDLYISDEYNNEIEEVNATTHDLSIVAGTGEAGPPTPGPATNSSFDEPQGVAVDSEGNVYVADWGNNVIEEVNGSTGELSIVAGNGSSSGPTPGPATSSSLMALPSLLIGNPSGDRFRRLSLED